LVAHLLHTIRKENPMKNFNKKLAQHIKVFVRDEEGATAVEYGLMVAMIAIAIYGLTQALGVQIGSTMNDATSKIASH
jgi:pilus assembly protein Flp/PilA